MRFSILYPSCARTLALRIACRDQLPNLKQNLPCSKYVQLSTQRFENIHVAVATPLHQGCAVCSAAADRVRGMSSCRTGPKRLTEKRTCSFTHHHPVQAPNTSQSCGTTDGVTGCAWARVCCRLEPGCRPLKPAKKCQSRAAAGSEAVWFCVCPSASSPPETRASPTSCWSPCGPPLRACSGSPSWSSPPGSPAIPVPA